MIAFKFRARVSCVNSTVRTFNSIKPIKFLYGANLSQQFRSLQRPIQLNQPSAQRQYFPPATNFSFKSAASLRNVKLKSSKKAYSLAIRTHSIHRYCWYIKNGFPAWIGRADETKTFIALCFCDSLLNLVRYTATQRFMLRLRPALSDARKTLNVTARLIKTNGEHRSQTSTERTMNIIFRSLAPGKNALYSYVAKDNELEWRRNESVWNENNVKVRTKFARR